MSTAKRPGIEDVAHAAGVSHQTVSRVLNDSPSVLSETRARVLQAIASLGYRPNAAARALASRRSGVIGVLAMESTLYGPASTLYAIERAARDAGYFVSVAAIDLNSNQGISSALDRLTLQGVEGVIAIVPLTGAAEVLATVASDIPVVVTQGDDGTDRPAVAVDQVLGAELATSHLLAQGAPTVWHIAGPEGWLEANRRIEGWHETLTSHGAEIPELLRGDWSPQSGYVQGRRLAEQKDVRAVFVANDHMALGLLRAFNEHGVRVPEDVLVAGFDDIPEAAYFTPPLTSVRQDFLAVGQRAIGLLLDEITGATGKPRKILVEPVLVPRQSTGGLAPT
jgi:DNA-binding LacI/PurR family transcriptional regulator